MERSGSFYEFPAYEACLKYQADSVLTLRGPQGASQGVPWESHHGRVPPAWAGPAPQWWEQRGGSFLSTHLFHGHVGLFTSSPM